MGLYADLKMRWVYWLAGKLPPCETITEWLSQSLEEPPTLRRRLTIRLHYLICVWCKRYGQQLRFMRQAARACADDLEGDASPAESLSPEARDRLKQALRRRQ